MNTQTKYILGGVASCLSGGLLAMNLISISPTAETAPVSSKQALTDTAPAIIFASHSTYCQAFLGIQGVGSVGVSAEYSAALNNAIKANGGDVKRTHSMIRETCLAVV
jgi:hypothetical protein